MNTLHRLLFTFGLLSTPLAHADVQLGFHSGYGIGKITTTKENSITSTPFGISLNLEFSSAVPVHVGLSFYHSLVRYVEDATVYQGTNVLSGINTGFQLLQLGGKFLQIKGEYLPNNSMQVKSTTSTTVNGESFKHSSLITYTGPGAITAGFLYVTEKTDGQFNKNERLRYGWGLSSLTQTIDKRTIQIATNDLERTPATKTRDSVDYKIQIIYLELFLGLTF